MNENKCRYCGKIFGCSLEVWEHQEKEHPIEYELELKNIRLENKKLKPIFIGNIFKFSILVLFQLVVFYLTRYVSLWFSFCFIPVIGYYLMILITLGIENKIIDNRILMDTKNRKQLEARSKELMRKFEKEEETET